MDSTCMISVGECNQILIHIQYEFPINKMVWFTKIIYLIAREYRSHVLYIMIYRTLKPDILIWSGRLACIFVIHLFSHMDNGSLVQPPGHTSVLWWCIYCATGAVRGVSWVWNHCTLLSRSSTLFSTVGSWMYWHCVHMDIILFASCIFWMISQLENYDWNITSV